MSNLLGRIPSIATCIPCWLVILDASDLDTHKLVKIASYLYAKTGIFSTAHAATPLVRWPQRAAAGITALGLEWNYVSGFNVSVFRRTSNQLSEDVEETLQDWVKTFLLQRLTQIRKKMQQKYVSVSIYIYIYILSIFHGRRPSFGNAKSKASFLDPNFTIIPC